MSSPGVGYDESIVRCPVSLSKLNFLVIKREEGDFTNINPFLISRTLKRIVGDLKNVCKVRDGLLVETIINKEQTRLLEITIFEF